MRVKESAYLVIPNSNETGEKSRRSILATAGGVVLTGLGPGAASAAKDSGAKGKGRGKGKDKDKGKKEEGRRSMARTYVQRGQFCSPNTR